MAGEVLNVLTTTTRKSATSELAASRNLLIIDLFTMDPANKRLSVLNPMIH